MGFLWEYIGNGYIRVVQVVPKIFDNEDGGEGISTRYIRHVHFYQPRASLAATGSVTLSQPIQKIMKWPVHEHSDFIFQRNSLIAENDIFI